MAEENGGLKRQKGFSDLNSKGDHLKPENSALAKKNHKTVEDVDEIDDIYLLLD